MTGQARLMAFSDLAAPLSAVDLPPLSGHGQPSFTPRAFAACKCGLGAPRYFLALMLCKHGTDAPFQGTHMGRVGGQDINAAIPNLEQEFNVTGQAVDLGNKQARALTFTMSKRAL
jgi:hypothetical protein